MNKNSAIAIEWAPFDKSTVHAGFTLKNPQYKQAEGRINGLNLGYNKLESAEVVDQNLSALKTELGIETFKVARARQIHGNTLTELSEEAIAEETDALFTNKQHLLLLIQVADCAPILIFDPKNRCIAAVHAGWRSAVANILPKTIAHFIRKGSKASDLQLAIGPCISAQAFEVGPEVAEQFPDAYVDYHRFAKPHVDLKGFLRQQALDQGVQKASIWVSPSCTIHHTDLCYSHRREGEKAGRMAAFIALK